MARQRRRPPAPDMTPPEPDLDDVVEPVPAWVMADAERYPEAVEEWHYLRARRRRQHAAAAARP